MNDHAELANSASGRHISKYSTNPSAWVSFEMLANIRRNRYHTRMEEGRGTDHADDVSSLAGPFGH